MLAAALSSHVRSEFRKRRFLRQLDPPSMSQSDWWKEPCRMTGIDWLILGLYFAFVLGIGVALKGSVKTSTDFFLAGRAIPAWVCGLAFMSANLGAQEVIRMVPSRPKFENPPSPFYWLR